MNIDIVNKLPNKFLNKPKNKVFRYEDKNYSYDVLIEKGKECSKCGCWLREEDRKCTRCDNKKIKEFYIINICEYITHCPDKCCKIHGNDSHGFLCTCDDCM